MGCAGGETLLGTLSVVDATSGAESSADVLWFFGPNRFVKEELGGVLFRTPSSGFHSGGEEMTC